MKQSTVLVAIQTSEFGGPHNQVVQLAGELDRRGWTTVALLPPAEGSGAKRLREAGVRMHQTPLHRLRKSKNPVIHLRYLTSFYAEVSRIRGILRQVEPDVVQVCGLMTLQAAVASKLEGRPIVWQLLGTFPPPSVRAALTPLVRRMADSVMTTGCEVARKHPGAVKMGGRLVPFFPPVDTNRFVFDEERRAAARAELGVAPDELLIGTVGNYYRAKAHEYLVQAAPDVLRRVPNAKFRILGSQSASNAEYYQREVRDRVKSLGLDEDGRFEFFSPGAAVADYLPAFDVFVLSSRDEGAPTALMEAMSCSRPCVTTQVGSVLEMVTAGEDGLVIAPLDADAIASSVVRLCEDPALRDRLGAAARRRAETEFDLGVCADTHVKAFEIATAARAIPGSSRCE